MVESDILIGRSWKRLAAGAWGLGSYGKIVGIVTKALDGYKRADIST
jgi:hypothetical protein